MESCDPLAHEDVYRRLPHQDSEESETEGGMGNLSRVVMRPPGQSGKAKRGHICFDASFETGNLGRVDLLSEYEYDLFIRPDTCNPRFRLWFNFIVDNIRTDQRVVFNIVNFSKNKILFRDGLTPLVKSTSRPKWQRIPNKQVFYYNSANHQNHYILSFAFGFDREDDVYQFAFSYPYSYSRCQTHLNLLEKRQLSHVQRELLGTSLQQRRLDLLTITHPNNMKPSNKRLRVVVILGRIHPGESPTSFVCQGLIDFLASNHPIAVALREHVVFKIVPMMNPDGVFLGNYRCTLMGFDLNRTWNQISRLGQPTLYAVNEMLTTLDQNKEIDLDFVLDLHAHSTLQGVFIYGNTYDDVYRYERHIVFPKLLSQNAEDYSPTNTMYNRDVNKQGTTRRYMCTTLKDSVNCYSLEVSFFGYSNPNTSTFFYYTEESYCRLGRNLARTFLDYYRSTGALASGPGASLGGGGGGREPRARRRRRAARSVALARQRSSDASRSPPRHRSAAPPITLVLDQGTPPASALRGRRVGGGGGGPGAAQSPPRPQPSPSPPRLTIIDFNQLTRGGIDQATRRRRRDR